MKFIWEEEFFKAVEKVNYPISSHLNFSKAIKSKNKIRVDEIVIPSIEELKVFSPANRNFNGFYKFIKVKANSKEANFYAEFESKYGRYFNSQFYSNHIKKLLFSFQAEIANNLVSNLVKPASNDSENYLNRLIKKAEMNILSLDEQVQFHPLHNYVENSDVRINSLVSSARVPKGILHILIKWLKDLLSTQIVYSEQEAKKLALTAGTLNGNKDGVEMDKKFEDLFGDIKYAKSCVEVLKRVSPPIINDAEEYCLGRSSKSAVVAFYNILLEKGRVERESDMNLAELFNRRFPKLNLDRTGRIFRDGKRAAYRKYEDQLRSLIK